MKTTRYDKYNEKLRTGGFLQISNMMIEKFGLNNAVCLTNLIGWCKVHSKKNDGWFFQSVEQQMEQTGLGDNTLRRAKKLFKDLEIIEVKRMGKMEGMYINYDVLDEYMIDDARMKSYRQKLLDARMKSYRLARMKSYGHKKPDKTMEHDSIQMVRTKLPKSSVYETIGANNTNNKKNTKHNNNIVSATADGLITSKLFDRFWSMYPRKVNKVKTRTIWNKLCKQSNRPKWRVIVNAIREQKKTPRWQDKQFILHPTTWLNQEYWNEDPAEMTVPVFHNRNNNVPSNRTGTGSGIKYPEGIKIE